MRTGGDDDVHMVRTTVDGVQRPASNLAVLDDCRFDETPLLIIEPASLVRHSRSSFQLGHWVGKLKSVMALNPAAFIAWQPRSIGRPRQKITQRLG